ncbi:MAG: hypothetical protein PHD43_20990 [Methylococcales bacterium]|nr:hypothetical protein [Methylococcales bacterium]
MQSSGKLLSGQFLQHQLQEVITLLEKSLVKRGHSIHHELVEAMLHKQHQTRIQEKFALSHPTDIGSILESLPLDQRRAVWEAIKNLHDEQVLLEVSYVVRQTLISGMEPEELNTDEMLTLPRISLQLFSDSLASRLFYTQVTEVHTRIAAMNAMTYLGMPVSLPQTSFSLVVIFQQSARSIHLLFTTQIHDRSLLG